MVDVRRATPEDAAEVVRLRGLMLAAMRGEPPRPGPWQEIAGQDLRAGRADG